MNTERHRRIPLGRRTDRACRPEFASRAVACDPAVERTCIGVRSNRRAFQTLLIGSLCLLTFSTGCGYTVGKNFSRDIKSVAVPIFENDTNRRGLEFQLTEAVQNEITKRSSYRLAKGLDADTRLTGRIVSFRKDVLGETRYDDPRELQLTMMVKVTWEDLRTGKLLAQQEIPLSPDAIPMAAQSEFSPEVGQSMATGLADANQLLARKIVNLMEIPW